MILAIVFVIISATAAAANPGKLLTRAGARGMGRPSLKAEAMSMESGGGELYYAGLRRDCHTGKTDFAMVKLPHSGRPNGARRGGGLVTIVLTPRQVGSPDQRSAG